MSTNTTIPAAPYDAVIACPHEISGSRIVLRFDPKQPGHNALKQLSDRMSAAAQGAAEPDDHDFKNFHRQLCERFGYSHDERDWRRDQVSLIEWIAGKVDAQRDALTGVVELAQEAHAHWDADRDMKVGKILLALAGYSPRYDPRADALHSAVAARTQTDARP